MKLVQQDPISICHHMEGLGFQHTNSGGKVGRATVQPGKSCSFLCWVRVMEETGRGWGAGHLSVARAGHGAPPVGGVAV